MCVCGGGFSPGLGRDEFTLGCVEDVLLEAHKANMPLVIDGVKMIKKKKTYEDLSENETSREKKRKSGNEVYRLKK